MSKKSQWQHNLDQVFLIDNGAYDIKFSTAHQKSQLRRMQNAKFIERNFNYENKYFIEEIDVYGLNNLTNIKNNFVRPLKRGLLYNIDTEIEIWEEAFKKLSNNDKFKDNMLIFTHTPFCPDKVIETYLEVIFEYFNFDACIKSLPHLFTSYYGQKLFPDINQNLQLVIDSGFTSTTIVPILNSRPIYNGIKRVDIGGKLLTNFLKESV
jgi:actin-related protein 6